MATQFPGGRRTDALALLQRAVAFAVVRERRDPGGLLDFHLPDAGWTALAEVVRTLERTHSALQGLVATEDDLGSLAIEAIARDSAETGAAERRTASLPISDIASLATAIERLVRDEPERWVAVPLANLRVPDRVMTLDADSAGGPRALLIPTLGNLADPAERRLGDGLRRQLREATGIRGRWVQSRFTTGPADTADAPGDKPAALTTDSRVGALLVSRQRAPLRLARHRAMAAARYTVAVWSVLDPPDDQHDGFALWPEVAEWQPTPWLTVQPPAIDVAQAPSIRARASGAEYEYGEYVLTEDDDTLRLPWRALAAASTARTARALLSAAWSLYIALHIPSVLQLPDRLVHLVAAREALCTPPKGVRGTSDKRWAALVERFDIYRRLAAELDVADAGLVESRVNAVRDIALHAGDISSLTLGGPIDSTRHKDIPRESLVPAVSRADAALAASAVARAAAGLVRATDASGYDDAAYEAHFAGATGPPGARTGPS